MKVALQVAAGMVMAVLALIILAIMAPSLAYAGGTIAAYLVLYGRVLFVIGLICAVAFWAYRKSGGTKRLF